MLKYLLQKEFLQIKRNAFLPKMIIGFPVMAILIFPLAANFEIKNIKLAVVNEDRSPESRELIAKVLSSGYFRLTFEGGRFDDALAAVDSDRSDLILEIPRGFESSLVGEGNAAVSISANAVNGTKGTLGSSYLAAIVQDYAAGIRIKKLAPLPNPAVPGVAIVDRYAFNPYLRYQVFMVPAIMVMILAMLCGFLPALNIVLEKEKGTMEQLNVTPVTKFQFILAKLIPHWIIGFVALTLSFLAARVIHGITPAGSFITIYALASVFMLAISGFGLIISNYAKSLQQAMFMIFFFVITWIFLSGLYTPVAGMPPWARLISHISPLRYFIAVVRGVVLRGCGFGDLLGELGYLIGFAVVFNGWAILSYRKTE